MKVLAHFCAIAVALLSSPSAADELFEVHAGCDQPRVSEHSHRFFVDPAHGSMENDGTEQRPWRSLAEVLDPDNHLVATQTYSRTKDGGLGPAMPINPAGPIKPGDMIVLMSGDQGDVAVRQLVNTEFISVVAGKDQTPLVRSMHLTGSSHWLFHGIKFQGVRPENERYRPLVWLESHDWEGPSDNIVLANNTFSTQDSTEQWSPADWVNKPYRSGFSTNARCTSLLDNHFFNLRDAVAIAGDQSLIQGNLIEKMGNDGIDIMASDLTIRDNRIRDGRHTPADPLHPDGIQGWSIGGATNRNVVIDSNSIINLDPADDNVLQGISIFDGHWDGLTISNNLVINNAWHAISIWGVDNAVVVNNTVASAKPEKFVNWIMVNVSKDNSPSTYVIVRNNIAPQFNIESTDVTFDHNIAQKKIIYRSGNGRGEAASGVIGDRNVIDPVIFGTFVDFDISRGKLDLRPGLTSAAARAGSDEAAPLVDIERRPRNPPIDIGAYAR